MNYLISNENAQNLVQIMNRLASVEVKGDSVEHIFASRMLLKQIIESLKEVKDDEEIKDKKEE